MKNGLFEHGIGNKYWYLDGKYHREDGPAIERANGNKYWYLNGKPHREDGPAVEHASGYKEWRVDGKIHREEGPAVEYASGNKEWWVNDELLDEYYCNLGCFEPQNREEALERLNRKPRPYSYELYMADINKLFPL